MKLSCYVHKFKVGGQPVVLIPNQGLLLYDLVEMIWKN